MKVKTIFISLSVIMTILYGCGKASTQKLDEMISVEGSLKYTGMFRGYGSENVSGLAKIYLTNNQYMLKLENFSTSNGPDLKVYLSTASSPTSFISLGDLKSTNGNQVYNISGTPDFTQHKYVLIHCERYNHLFGSAELTK
ncbi:MAG: DM13 domain-containing protein [Ginsengibacter sp.]